MSIADPEAIDKPTPGYLEAVRTTNKKKNPPLHPYLSTHSSPPSLPLQILNQVLRPILNLLPDPYPIQRRNPAVHILNLVIPAILHRLDQAGTSQVGARVRGNDFGALQRLEPVLCRTQGVGVVRGTAAELSYAEVYCGRAENGASDLVLLAGVV